MKNKLMLTTALSASMLIAAVAHSEITGDVTNTFTLGSDKGADNIDSATRFGNEINLKYKNKVDLTNGMYASVSGKIELDNNAGDGADNDNEYEVQIGMGNFYVGAGSDSGNNISGSVLPIIGYAVGSLAEQVSNDASAQGDFIGGDEANEYQHISANYKAAGGTFSIVYAPNETSNANDVSSTSSTSGTGLLEHDAGSVTSVLYNGSPMPGLKVMIGRNTEQNATNSAAEGETDTDRLGLAYNFGQFSIGAERTTSENSNNTTDLEADRFAISFAASKELTLGAQYQVVENKLGGKHDEKSYTLDLGYNLGGLTFLAQYVNAEGLGADVPTSTAIDEYEGLVFTTKMNF
jgi:hypothetical protein